MKFIISSSYLLKQLSSLGGILSTSNALPILDNFLFELDKKNLRLSASDLETTMSVDAVVESKDEGRVAIPGRLLLDTLKTFPDQPLTFTIDLQKDAIEILSDSGKYKLVGYKADDFPKPVELEKPSSVKMDAALLRDAIDKTLFAIGTDELRPVMTGMLVALGPDGITFVSTNAHQLVKYTREDIKSKTPSSYIIPRKPLMLLKNILGSKDVKIEYGAANIRFEFENVSVVTKLIDGKYPNYEAIIPKNSNMLTVDRMELLSSIRRVAIYSNRNTHIIRLKIAGSKLGIMAEDLDNSNEANESIKCEYKGSPLEIGFNSKFLSEILGTLSTEEVLIELETPQRAALVKPVETDEKNKNEILMLIMPVMLT